ncbi:MAG: hypothetical protein OM95_04305 [Bdellovibrio sp. ArHS]|uniref:nitric oxide reductase activation protein NorD n=1 Tax=Bdellovibrio sp. ArHS TaxID=1569284 RepID=UPI0005828370|nr:hypothetical protein [Bdellovibrio sp. ArHS]KHD89352.1 MAG: hypothetical protein OM95_04305 [Bdellovibrio sp. ArHS]
MGWDEGLFGFFFKRYESSLEALKGPSLTLEPLKYKLEILASFNWGASVQIVSVDDTAFFDGHRLYLPEKIYSKQGATACETYYLFSTLLLTAPLRSDVSLAELLTCLGDRYPGFENLHQRAQQYYPDFFAAEVAKSALGGWGARDFTEIKAGVLGADTKMQVITEEKTTARDNVRMKRNRRLQKLNEFNNEQDENPLVHAFEKVFTLDQFKGGRKKVDSSDDLDEHKNALRELRVDSTVRSDQTTRAFIKVDLQESLENISNAETASEGRVYHYPEWNYRDRSFKKNWVKLFEGVYPVKEDGPQVLPPLNEEEKKIHQVLKNRFIIDLNQRLLKRGVLEGNDIDIDRLLDFQVSRLSGETPQDKVYQNKELARSDWSILILLDRSLSTDSWIGDHRVLDMEVSCLKILMNLLPDLPVTWGAASFYSNTRHEVHFDWLHSFADKNYQRVELQDIRPSGSTRLGPVVRHAVQVFSQIKSRKKMVLFLSDLKPTDFDFYEGSYGVSDFRKSVMEARAEGISFHMLGFSSDSHEAIKKYFSVDEYDRVVEPQKMKEALWRWLKKRTL